MIRNEAEYCDWLVAAARWPHRTAEAVPVVADAVRCAEMDPADLADERLARIEAGFAEGLWCLCDVISEGEVLALIAEVRRRRVKANPVRRDDAKTHR